MLKANKCNWLEILGSEASQEYDTFFNDVFFKVLLGEGDEFGKGIEFIKDKKIIFPLKNLNNYYWKRNKKIIII